MLFGRRVTVMGLGHFGGGVAAARWLAGQGAAVTVTDLADQTHLADALDELAGVPLASVRLGGHREEDFREAEILVVNPAVKPGNLFVQLAADAGARITTEIDLFLQACPARMVGVTGSNGKSTTTAMTAAILKADGRRTFLGGNLGGSLLPQLDAMQPDDWAVLELSSFQLWYLSPAAHVPEVAVITNCTPNHLNWHPDLSHYRAAKQRLLDLQPRDSVAVLNAHDPEVAGWTPRVRGRVVPPVPLEEIPNLPVPGIHNRINAACAAAACRAIGCGEDAIRRALRAYRGLSQRLERIAVIGGRSFYNDSTATTPESTIAALTALDPVTWLLAGGSDKGADFHDLARAIVDRALGAAFYGKVRERLAAEVRALAPHFRCVTVETLDEAVQWCWHAARPGENIVLSPACASHDQFVNFRARGETFVQLVRALAQQPQRPGLIDPQP